MIRYFLIFLFIICCNCGFCQSDIVVSDSSNEYLSQLQTFIQQNESLKIPDSVKYQNLYNKIRSLIIAYPKNENNFLFIYWGVNLSYKQLDTLLKLVDTSIYSSAQKSYANVALKRALAVETGKPFPELDLTDTSGNKLSISSLKGKVVLLDLWSSWCVSCREEIPALIKLFKKYNSKGFEVIGISMDDNKEKWLKAIKDDKQPWKAVCELKKWSLNTLASRFSLYTIPANFLIDQNGILVGQDLSAETIKYWLQQHL